MTDALARSSTTFGPNNRWYVEVTYAMEDGELLPVDVHVRLLPPGVELSQVQQHKDFVRFQAPVNNRDDLGPIPAGGLSQRQLCSVPLAGLADRFKEAARTNLAAAVPMSLDLTPYAEDAPRRPGRPPATPMRERLRILAAVEAGLAEGDSLDSIARSLLISRSSLRDLLSWARNDAQPRLFTNPGRGKRGGQLTPAARALMAQLAEKADDRG